MGGTDIGSGDCVPINAVPCCLKGGDNSGERAASIIAKKSGGVFRHKESWAESRNNSQTLTPHPSLIGFPQLLAGDADGLARHAGTNNIDAPFAAVVWRKRLNLSPACSVWPVSRQHPRCVLVSLYLPLASHAGSLEA